MRRLQFALALVAALVILRAIWIAWPDAGAFIGAEACALLYIVLIIWEHGDTP